MPKIYIFFLATPFKTGRAIRLLTHRPYNHVAVSFTPKGERLFSWIEADIDYSDVNGFYFLPDGRVAALLMEWPEDGKGSSAKISVVILTATPREGLPEKTTLITPPCI